MTKTSCSPLPEHAIEWVKSFLVEYQNRLCQGIEAIDAVGQFFRDEWSRNEGGGGISCVLENGNVFERAGINFSHVFGETLPAAATKTRPELAGRPFEALGVSIVFHPNNPYLPTTHANIRFFMTTDIVNAPIWWFGGGFDLTPYYPFEEDCIKWHQQAKQATQPYENILYPKWKQWCDEYFYLPHRSETRGIGGLFFDDFCDYDFETCFQIFKNVGNCFWEAYQPIAMKRKDHAYTSEEKQFQLYRRGRYVEFNLLYDRGTLFGIQSQGRTESILMSMPPQVVFKYNWQPKENSKEDILYQRYLKPQDWLK